MNDKASTYCSSNPGDCSKYGSYDPAASSTYAQVPNINFQITYSDGDGASGDFVKDTLVVGGKSVKGFQFGHAYSSNSNLGTIGLGYSAFAFGTDGGTPAYPTLPQALKINKLINLNAYSVWLNSIEAQAGSVLYGGVDTAKYSGPLTVLPIQKTDLSSKGTRSYEELIVNLNFASYGDIKSSAAQVLFDTGTEYTQLPEDFVSSVYTAMNAVPDSAYKYYFADCSMVNSKKTMDFQFGTKPKLITIRVPLSSFVYTPYQNTAVPNNAMNEPLCGLALIKVPNSGDPAILGDSFMRAAYTVFDLTNNQISIAQAKYTSASNVVEIPAGGVSGLKI